MRHHGSAARRARRPAPIFLTPASDGTVPHVSTSTPGRARRIPPLVVPLLLAVLAGAAYGWRLSNQGWANVYYAGIAQAGSHSWVAAFFGALDANAVVATDKPPLAFWPMSLSVWLLGLSPVAVLLPQLLESVATVLLLYAAVRRLAGPWAAALAGVVLAVTPVFFVLARYDDPDTLLTLWVVLAAWAAVRCRDDPRRGWLLLAAACFGAAFLTKWVAGLVAAPAFVLALWPVLGAAGRSARRRLLGAAAFVCVVAGGWWVAVLAVLGPERRPHADASGGNLLKLIAGSNGFGRLPGSGGGQVSGQPGPFRLVTAPFADQVGWFLPAALVLLVLLVLWRRAGAVDDRTWFGVVLFGGWTVLAAGLFSGMGGAMHPYYTTYLAPPVAAVVALGTVVAARAGRWRLLAVVLILTSGYAALTAYATGLPSGMVGVVAGTGLAGVVLLGVRRGIGSPGSGRTARWPGVRRVLVAVLAVVACLAGPVATDVVTLRHTVNGPNPRAGIPSDPVATTQPPALLAFLHSHDDGDWIAAVPQASPAAAVQLATDRPVLALGGFTGSEPAPSIDQLRTWVREGRLRYVVLAGYYTRHPRDTPEPMRRRPLAALMDWSRANGCVFSVGGAWVIDLRRRCPMP